MATKRKSFLDGIETNGAEESKYRKTAKKKTEELPEETEQSAPADSSAAPKRRGRPKSEQQTMPLLLRPKPDNVRRLRVYAAERGIGTSKVFDALVERYLDDMDM